MKKRILEYSEAVRLRKEGLSYSQINRVLKVSKSPLSSWLRVIPISSARKTTLSESFRMQGKRLHAERLKRTAATIGLAREEIGVLTLRELKIAGAMLYWAEGTKSAEKENVAVSNSDPRLIQLALQWLRIICGIPDQKIRVQMHIHTDLDPEECLGFWMQVTRLPRDCFTKPYIKRSSLGRRKKLSYRGTIQIRVSDKQLYRRIQGWIEGLQVGHLAPVAQLDRAVGF